MLLDPHEYTSGFLALQRNNLSGNTNVVDFMCNNTEIVGFLADCAATPPEILCPCCTTCCKDNSDCKIV